MAYKASCRICTAKLRGNIPTANSVPAELARAPPCTASNCRTSIYKSAATTPVRRVSAVSRLAPLLRRAALFPLFFLEQTQKMGWLEELRDGVEKKELEMEKIWKLTDGCGAGGNGGGYEEEENGGEEKKSGATAATVVGAVVVEEDYGHRRPEMVEEVKWSKFIKSKQKTRKNRELSYLNPYIKFSFFLSFLWFLGQRGLKK